VELSVRVASLTAILVGGSACARDVDAAQPTVAPPVLRATGFSELPIRPFAPQYPLWSDGAAKRRWIYLPAPLGADWVFPVGARLWKQFAFGGSVVETRYMERTATGWLYASYAGGDDDAARVPERGAITSVEVAPGRRHVIPSATDCVACHGNGASPVLGFTPLQLSADRDPNAPHAERRPEGSLDLPALIASGLAPAQDAAPQIAARSADERAALGYLAANCGACHRGEGALASLDMDLASRALATTVDRASHFTTSAATVRVVPGAPEHSVLIARIGSRSPVAQMPPLGTQILDIEAIALVTRWIAQLPTLSETTNAGDYR
jgi:mono/diheme cytochrome c family protein